MSEVNQGKEQNVRAGSQGMCGFAGRSQDSGFYSEMRSR